MTAITLREVRDDLSALLARVDAALAAEAEPHATAEPPSVPAAPAPSQGLAWGARVSEVFRDRVRWIGQTLGFDPNWLMACIAFESGRTFSASVRNAAGSGACGLVQFMPATAAALGTTVEKLAAMTAEDQLNYVFRYLKPYSGRIKALSDLYMSILWPAAIGKPESYPLFTSGIAYRQNAGLDLDHDGSVTKAEAAAKVYATLTEGLKPENRA